MSCIAGRVILNNDFLTQERFIPNPYQNEQEKVLGKNTRLYKTGDLVRWLSEGDLEYIGRADFQVKLRGYRIELGEIESVLSSYPGIKQSVALLRHGTVADTGGPDYLVGYYVSEEFIEERLLYGHLEQKLPDYMIPSILVQLESLPVTANGKLDRKALPNPEFKREDQYVAPRNELERSICQIWAEVLGLPEDKVGINDNFFRLGGHSILAIKLVSKLNRELNTTISVAGVFKDSNVSQIRAAYKA